MKAKTTCPICKKEIISECYGCISSKSLVHKHKEKIDVLECEWEILKE